MTLKPEIEKSWSLAQAIKCTVLLFVHTVRSEEIPAALIFCVNRCRCSLPVVLFQPGFQQPLLPPWPGWWSECPETNFPSEYTYQRADHLPSPFNPELQWDSDRSCLQLLDSLQLVGKEKNLFILIIDSETEWVKSKCHKCIPCTQQTYTPEMLVFIWENYKSLSRLSITRQSKSI